MGFGIALTGYAFMLLYEIGGTLFAALIMGYGFFLASRLEGYFLNAAVTSLFMLPYGIFRLLTAIGVTETGEHIALHYITSYLFLAAWALMSFFWLTAVMRIARENKAFKMERQARNRLVITVAGIFVCAFTGIDGVSDMLGAAGSAFRYLLIYALIFINIFFLHTCFVMITSESRYEKDRQQLASERAEALKKKERERKEVAGRIEKRK